MNRDYYEVIVLKNFEDPNLDSFLLHCAVRVYHEESTIGEALAKGIRLALADIVCFLDDDDLFLPQKLSYVASAFTSDLKLGYYHNSFIVEGSESETRRLARGQPRHKPLAFDSEQLPHRSISPRAPWLGFNMSSVSIRKGWVVEMLPLLEQLGTAPDGFFIVAALSKGVRSIFDPQVLTVYRYHDSLSHFLEGSAEQQNASELSHTTKYLQALSVFHSLSKGTPIEAIMAYDYTYWRVRYSLFNLETKLPIKPAEIALFLREGLRRKALHPFYLIPAYFAVGFAPRITRKLFRQLSNHVGHP